MKIRCSKTQAEAIRSYFSDPANTSDREKNLNFLRMLLGDESAELQLRLAKHKMIVEFVGCETFEGPVNVCDCAVCQVEMKELVAAENAELTEMGVLKRKRNLLHWINAMMQTMAKIYPESMEAVGAVLSELDNTHDKNAMEQAFLIFRRCFYDLRDIGIKANTIKSTAFDDAAEKEKPRLRVVAQGAGEILFGNGEEMRQVAAWSDSFDAAIHVTPNMTKLRFNDPAGQPA